LVAPTNDNPRIVSDSAVMIETQKIPAGARRSAGDTNNNIIDEQFCTAGPVELCYETIGDPGDPSLLLIVGLGFQLVAWPRELCQRLADRGFHVIRYDNRDSGRSTYLDDSPPPSLRELVTGRIRRPAYTLADMARDATGLLDHLDVDRAHIIGRSMGGMIAQTLAAQSPERVRSLVSIMSNTGSRLHGQPRPSVLRYLLTPPPDERERYIQHGANLFALAGTPGNNTETELRDLLGLTFDRGTSADGYARQLGAIFATGNRTRALRTITAPTLVVHGLADRAVAPSGGHATARAIRDAHLLLLAGMGHDLPRDLWPLITDAITRNTERAERSPATA
jgi:pimeloyl-ACP methyl ester carboxylesterase